MKVDSLASTSSSSSDAGDDTAPETARRDDFIEGPVLRNIKSHVVHKSQVFNCGWAEPFVTD